MQARCSLHREFRPCEDQGCEARTEAARDPFLWSLRMERKVKKHAEPSFSRCARLFSFFHPIAISKNIRILTPAFPALKKGTWTVLDFWATWCPDCRREIPTVKEMYKKYGTCAKFIGVSMDTDKQKLDNYTQANGVEWEQYSEFKK